MASRGRRLSPAGCCCRLLWLLSTLSCWPPPTVVGARSSSSSASSSAALQEASIRPELIEALLAESLRLHLVQACQGERVSLHCPRNTHISPQNSFFGRLVPSRELCPGQAPQQSEDTSCDFAEAHSCPGTGKYLQIGYKCSPVSFEDQNFCEGQQTRLGCKQGQRLSIYSAHFGRTVNGQAMHCKGGAGGGERPLVQKDCVADVLPQIARRCHAQPWCSFPVDSRFLGSPCPAGVPKYLSVIFVCVNEEVFSEAALRGRLEAMEQLDRELNSLRRNASGQPVPTPNSWRHPLLGDRRSEEDSEEEEEEEEEQQQQHFEVDEQRRTKDGPAAEWTEVEEQKTPVAETNSAVVEAKTSAEIGEPNRNRDEDWPWALLAEHRRQALLPWLLLLLLFPCLLAVLSACLLWQCRARLRERKERKRAEERAANNRKLGDGRFCVQPTSSAGGYLLDSDGSSQRLLPLPSDTFLPSPPVQYNNGNGSDIYHGCYVPTLGSCSAGSGSAYGGSGGGGGGGYYMGMGGGHFAAGRMPTTAAAAATTTEEFAWAQLRRLPPSLHCYS